MSWMIWPSGKGSEPREMTDAEWWRHEEEFACEDDAIPTYEELIAREASGYFDSEIV